jgi:hypothetical protein
LRWAANFQPLLLQARRWITHLVLGLLLAGTASADEDFEQTLVKGGRVLELRISAEFNTAERQQLVTWMDFISTALLQVYGHWPRHEWLMSVTPAAASNTNPIPWAEVHRDAVDDIEFFVAPGATAEQLKQDWTGYHELAHLLIPYRGWGDSWFSEGIASYYQTILQARSGLLSEQQAWQRLYEGFQRGEAEIKFDGQTLQAISETMREDGGFMRVYWSGAWYFLAVDIGLRQQSSGKNSLDLALQKLNQCCADQQLSVPQIVSKLDELNEVLLFQQYYDRAVVATQMPAYDNIFASLGISVQEGEVRLQNAGPGALLRRDIVQPRGM